MMMDNKCTHDTDIKSMPQKRITDHKNRKPPSEVITGGLFYAISL